MSASLATASSTRLALAAACGAGFLWGTGALVVNVLIERHGFTPENISFWRFVVGAIVLLAVFGRAPLLRALRPVAGTVLFAGASMAGYVLFWFLGIERIGAAVPTLISLCLAPVLVTIVSVLRGRERLDRGLVRVLGGALLGTFLLVAPHGGGPLDVSGADLAAGIAFSVASATLYAGVTLVSGRLSNTLGAGPSAACLTVVAAATMALAGLWRPLAWPTEAAPEAWFLYLGVVTAALALLAFSWGATRLSPTALTVATLVEPLTAVVLAALLLGQHLQSAQWIGAALLIASIWALGRRVAAQPHA